MLEIEKPPPWNSSGFSFPARARPARSFISRLIVARPFDVRLTDDRRDQPIRDRNRHADIDVVVERPCRRRSNWHSPPALFASVAAAALITMSLMVIRYAPGASFGGDFAFN